MARPPLAIVVAIVVCYVCFARVRAACQTSQGGVPRNVERARVIFREGFDSGDYTVRIEAIVAAGMVGRNEVRLTRLQGFLEDKNVEVRLATIHTLSDLKSVASRDSLRKTLEDDKTPEVSFAAAKALALMDDPQGEVALMQVYQGERKTKSSIIKEQERSFFDEFHSVPSAIVFTLSKGVGYAPVPGAGEGFSALLSLMKEHEFSERAAVLMILAQTKNAESLKLLGGALEDRDWSVRAAAAQMISQTAQTKLRDSLVHVFDDKSEKVRFRAAGAYLHLSLLAKSSSSARAQPTQ